VKDNKSLECYELPTMLKPRLRSYWESFESSVDLNPSLLTIKFGYFKVSLKALLFMLRIQGLSLSEAS